MSAPSRARLVARRAVYALTVVMVLIAAAVVVVDGQLPVPVPSDAPAWSLSPLADALQSVDGQGQVNLVELKKRHASLETFARMLAATSPATRPELFPTVEARLAFWLNAYHAAVLLELLETRSSTSSSFDEHFRGLVVGGTRVTRFSMLRNTLSESGDARVSLSIASGERGRGVLDGAPFDPESLNFQLDDAVRRFVQRKDHVAIDGTTVRLSKLFELHREEFLAALPDERKNVLQVVWAYLPETCEPDAPRCHTRGELDRACGPRFDACQLVFVEIDRTLSVTN